MSDGKRSSMPKDGASSCLVCYREKHKGAKKMRKVGTWSGLDSWPFFWCEYDRIMANMMDTVCGLHLIFGSFKFEVILLMNLNLPHSSDLYSRCIQTTIPSPIIQAQLRTWLSAAIGSGSFGSMVTSNLTEDSSSMDSRQKSAQKMS